MILKSNDLESLRTEVTKYLNEIIKDIPDENKAEKTNDEFISTQLNEVLNP